MNIQTYTDTHTPENQASRHAKCGRAENKCTMKQTWFVWKDVWKFFNVEEYAHVPEFHIERECSGTPPGPSAVSYAHIEIQMTDHFPTSIWNTETHRPSGHPFSAKIKFAPFCQRLVFVSVSP